MEGGLGLRELAGVLGRDKGGVEERDSSLLRAESRALRVGELCLSIVTTSEGAKVGAF